MQSLVFSAQIVSKRNFLTNAGDFAGEKPLRLIILRWSVTQIPRRVIVNDLIRKSIRNDIPHFPSASDSVKIPVGKSSSPDPSYKRLPRENMPKSTVDPIFYNCGISLVSEILRSDNREVGIACYPLIGR